MDISTIAIVLFAIVLCELCLLLGMDIYSRISDFIHSIRFNGRID